MVMPLQYFQSSRLNDPSMVPLNASATTIQIIADFIRPSTLTPTNLYGAPTPHWFWPPNDTATPARKT